MIITIVARNIVRDGKREAFLEAVRPLIAASRSEEGNIAYDLYEDINEANAFCFIEKWKDPEAIAAHNASSHFRESKACKAASVISGTLARDRIL